MLIVKGILIFLSTILSIIALVRIGKKKIHFQIFPDSIKKDFFKEARLVNILNIISVGLIFVSFFLISSNFFYILVLASMFLSVNALVQIEEDFGDLKDDSKKNK